MKRIILALLFFGFALSMNAGTKDAKQIYKDAFAELLQMLDGREKPNFKRAVFISENAYHKGNLNYQSFCNEITTTGQRLKSLIRQRGLEKYKTSGNWAVFTYMTDTLPINSMQPFTYDFDDFMGDKDWSIMFVTNLMKTKKGNCHSLPYYYKILCEEIGANASLALAPNHVYIKHINEEGQWSNVELTSGGFPSDQWVIQQMAITVEAIKNESYMKPLTDNESIALCMFDLVSAYRIQFPNDDFVIEVTDSALKYFPNCIPLQMVKANYTKVKIEDEWKKANPDREYIDENIQAYEQITATIDSLGDKEMPPEQYQQWVKSVEEEKAKRNIVNKQ